MRRLIILIVLFIFSFGFFSGCKSRMIRGAALEETLSLSSLEQTLAEETADELVEEIIVGFNSLEDKRPQEDIAYMTSVREKVSNQILNILQETKIFDDIHSPATKDDIIIVNGEIRRFNWESYDTMISYIPGLNVLPFFGLPSTTVDSEVDIYLVIKDNKTNKIILDLNESYGKRRKYNIYNFKQEKAEAELAKCFDIVLMRLKDRLLKNKDKILDGATSIALEEAKQRELLKAQEMLKAEALPEPKVEKISEVKTEEKITPETKAEPEIKIEGAVHVNVEEVVPSPAAVEQKPEIKTGETPELKSEEITKEAEQEKTENVPQPVESEDKAMIEENIGE